MLAAKSALAARVDAFGEETNVQLGLDHRAKLEMRIRQLDNKGVRVSVLFFAACFLSSFTALLIVDAE